MVRSVRRFNRTVTQRVGALNDAYLSRDRPLGQCRVLWEIGSHGCEVRGLRERLDLDSGYLSRLLRALEGDGLVSVESDDDDARVRTVRLSEAGAAEVALLDARSDDLATEILRPLDAGQRDRLVAAMAEVERLLTASMVHIGLHDPGTSDARYCIGEFFGELNLRFDTGFDPRLSNSAEDARLVPPAGAFFVATLHGEPVGCGAVKLHGKVSSADPGTPSKGGPAEIKRMWVSPDVRGLGVGRRMLRELETFAALNGVGIARLETNRSLTEAISLYRACGYREVDPFNDEPYAHHWLEKTLEPAWERDG